MYAQRMNLISRVQSCNDYECDHSHEDAGVYDFVEDRNSHKGLSSMSLSNRSRTSDKVQIITIDGNISPEVNSREHLEQETAKLREGKIPKIVLRRSGKGDEFQIHNCPENRKHKKRSSQKEAKRKMSPKGTDIHKFQTDLKYMLKKDRTVQQVLDLGCRYIEEEVIIIDEEDSNNEEVIIINDEDSNNNETGNLMNSKTLPTANLRLRVKTNEELGISHHATGKLIQPNILSKEHYENLKRIQKLTRDMSEMLYIIITSENEYSERMLNSTKLLCKELFCKEKTIAKDNFENIVEEYSRKFTVLFDQLERNIPNLQQYPNFAYCNFLQSLFNSVIGIDPKLKFTLQDTKKLMISLLKLNMHNSTVYSVFPEVDYLSESEFESMVFQCLENVSSQYSSFYTYPTSGCITASVPTLQDPRDMFPIQPPTVYPDIQSLPSFNLLKESFTPKL